MQPETSSSIFRFPSETSLGLVSQDRLLEKVAEEGRTI